MRKRPSKAVSAKATPEAAWPVGWLLLAFAAIAAVLRLAAPGHYPPGLNQDEAINAWNAFCLLRTGHDMTGASWPIFYSHAIGDQRSTLFFYLLMPIQAIFGLSAWSTRLPAAILGTACVPLAAIVARRLFGDRAAIAAALLVAIDPWHVFLSRIGIEGGVTPFLSLLPLALLARARLLAPRDDEPPRAGWALAAGLAAGIGCYGYWSVRLWMPAALILLALVAGRATWVRLREATFGRAVAACAVGFAITFGPLAWRHLTDPAIGHRSEMTRLWAPGTPLPQVIGMIAQRWAIHFGPTFLFTRGDSYELLQPPVGGALPLYLAPLLLLGLGCVIAGWRRPAERVLLALVVAWPLGDVLAAYDGVHSLRSAIGSPALLLLAAVGAACAIRWAARFGVGQRAMAALLVLVALASSVRAYAVAFGEFDKRPGVWHGYQSELLEAATWLRTHARPGEPVVFTVTGFNEPWSIVLVAMAADPRKQWFESTKERRILNGWDVYPRIGDWWFLYDPADVQRRALTPARPAWLVVRAGEGRGTPALVIRDPQGRESLQVLRVTP